MRNLLKALNSSYVNVHVNAFYNAHKQLGIVKLCGAKRTGVHI